MFVYVVIFSQCKLELFEISKRIKSNNHVYWLSLLVTIQCSSLYNSFLKRLLPESVVKKDILLSQWGWTFEDSIKHTKHFINFMLDG